MNHQGARTNDPLPARLPACPPDGWAVEPDAPDAAAYAALAGDRAWNGYSITDLEPPFRAHARFALARRGDAADTPPGAACLFLRHPAFSAIIPHGEAAGLAAILAHDSAAGALPPEAFLLARDEHLPAIEALYDFPGGRQEMARLAVDAAAFRPQAGLVPAPQRLGPADLPALLDLYAAYPDNAFNDDQLASGPFYGFRDGERLVAAGGTHVVAARYGIAAVGNVYTRHDFRGRGYGAAVTAAVVADLLAAGCGDVILNVGVANSAARHLYARLGFREHCRYWEGRVRLKVGGLAVQG